MEKVKLSDALKVSKITTRYGVIDKFSRVDEAVFIHMNDVSGQLTEDALYWTGSSWEITWIMVGTSTNVVIPRIMGEFVKYQEMVDLISKHKETEMEKAFKLSEVIKVADAALLDTGVIVRVDTNVDEVGSCLVYSAGGSSENVIGDSIEWRNGEWFIDRRHGGELVVKINNGTIIKPDELYALLKNQPHDQVRDLDSGEFAWYSVFEENDTFLVDPKNTTMHSDNGVLTIDFGNGRKMVIKP